MVTTLKQRTRGRQRTWELHWNRGPEEGRVHAFYGHMYEQTEKQEQMCMYPLPVQVHTHTHTHTPSHRQGHGVSVSLSTSQVRLPRPKQFFPQPKAVCVICKDQVNTYPPLALLVDSVSVPGSLLD